MPTDFADAVGQTPGAGPVGHSRARMPQRLTPTGQQPWAPERQRLLPARRGTLLGHAQLPQHERECQASNEAKVSSIKRDSTKSLALYL